MKIAICADHRGYDLKSELVKKLVDNNIAFEDFGCFSSERCDYPLYAFKVGEAVSKGLYDFGVVICGSGDGVSIAANKVKGVRCVCLNGVEHVIRAREHVDMNVLALAAEQVNVDEAMDMVEAMISTKALGERYAERKRMIDEYERRN